MKKPTTQPDKVDFRNYINPHPRYAASGQRERLGDDDPYVEDKQGKVIEAVIQSVRKGSRSVVRVDELFLLAPIKGGPAKRKKELGRRIDAVKARGGVVMERSSGARSDQAGFASAIVRAVEMIANGGRGGAGKGRRGKRRIELTPHEDAVARGVWFSRQYANDDERVTAIEKRIGRKLKRSWLWNRYGSPHKAADKS